MGEVNMSFVPFSGPLKLYIIIEPPCDKAKKNGICAQRRLRSAWASAQSDQSLRCPYEESWGPKLPIERTVKTLIRLGRSPG